ncbi:hypothetical protein AB6A40_006843 [Gnathostoma spinigerum]|uniref:Uncharacterized protein n=1 Tax=Gnathostoma spinigerum TaxID=75299 RepID=A0ABD6ES60_9BILA
MNLTLNSSTATIDPTRYTQEAASSTQSECNVNISGLNQPGTMYGQPRQPQPQQRQQQQQSSVHSNGSNTRSQSRSTEGSGSGGLTPSNSTQPNTNASQANSNSQGGPMSQLGTALQQATGIEAPPSSFSFNSPDIFSSFPSNPNLLQYQMRQDLMGLSGFRAPNGNTVNAVRTRQNSFRSTPPDDSLREIITSFVLFSSRPLFQSFPHPGTIDPFL